VPMRMPASGDLQGGAGDFLRRVTDIHTIGFGVFEHYGTGTDKAALSNTQAIAQHRAKANKRLLTHHNIAAQSGTRRRKGMVGHMAVMGDIRAAANDDVTANSSKPSAFRPGWLTLSLSIQLERSL